MSVSLSFKIFPTLTVFLFSGEQAKARPGLHEAGAAVQRTRLRDPQRVSRCILTSSHRYSCFTSPCPGGMCCSCVCALVFTPGSFPSLASPHLESSLKGTLTGIFVDSRLWDLILTLYATTSPPNLIWRAEHDSQILTWIASVRVTFPLPLQI